VPQPVDRGPPVTATTRRAGTMEQPRALGAYADAEIPEAAAPLVQAEHRLRPHQHQVAAPVGADPPDHRPEHPVAASEPRARAGAVGDGQLLPEQVLHQERVPAAAQQA
jgi:hypothetical protein